MKKDERLEEPEMPENRIFSESKSIQEPGPVPDQPEPEKEHWLLKPLFR